MSIYCLILKEKVVYLICQECEEKECKKTIKKTEEKPD